MEVDGGEQHEQLHFTKTCDLQRADKTWAPGSLFVYATRAVWKPSQTADAGSHGEQWFPLKDLSECCRKGASLRRVRALRCAALRCIGAPPLRRARCSCALCSAL